MCRFALYMGTPIQISALVTDPSHSLVHQSYHAKEREEPLNGDGFGIAWYAPAISSTPGLYKDISPAWNNRNLHGLSKVIKSPCILAHVRAATGGTAVNYANCHPFTRDEFSFMHNGAIGDFAKIKRTLRNQLSDTAYSNIEGSTDSEHAFALMMDHYRQARANNIASQQAMLEALQQTITDIQTLKNSLALDTPKPCQLNFVLCDGQNAIISRYTSGTPEKANSLYYWQGKDTASAQGLHRFQDTALEQSNALIIASEPLTQDNRWIPVPPNHLLIVSNLANITLEAIELKHEDPTT